MKMDFDDEMFDFDDEMPDAGDTPDFRATVQRSGTVRLVYWGPWLQSTGPAYTLLARPERAGIAVADLTVVRDGDGLAREVIVAFHAGGGGAHTSALIDWASAAGYNRIWLDGELVDLEPVAGGLVRTRCTGCGVRFVDGSSDAFWRTVRGSGAFPVACALCGSDLPQWTPAARAEPAARDGKLRVRERVAGPIGRAYRR